MWFSSYGSGQTERQTNILITILRYARRHGALESEMTCKSVIGCRTSPAYHVILNLAACPVFLRLLIARTAKTKHLFNYINLYVLVS